MDIVLVAVSSFAVWRAAHMLQDETGPAGVIARFRAWLAQRDSGNLGSLYDGFTCFYCLSIWLAPFPAMYGANTLAEFLIYWFAISACAVFLNMVAINLEQ